MTDRPWTCLQGPRSKVCTILLARDPGPQLTALLDHMLCTKAAQRDPGPNPTPPPQPPVTSPPAKLSLHNRPHTQPASVALTDDLRAGKDTESRNPVPWTQYKPQNTKSLPQYTHTTSNPQSHKQSHPSTVLSTHIPQSTHP